ncbi:MAG: formate dehydrogenase accessory protein FdhE [Deltaproteobacteria bacterium]|nr:formate dehydrogenase accessory protein FdhE [Deltaproteobacteria bacterium]
MDNHLQRLRRLQERNSNYRDILTLAEKLLEEKSRAKKQGSFPSIPLDPFKVRIQMEEGFPYLRPVEIPVAPTQVKEYFLGLLKILKEQNPEEHEALRRTMENPEFVFDRFLRSLLENCLTENHLVQELGKEGSLLFFFLVQSLKPTFEFHAESWRRKQKELSFVHGFCPFCGGIPGLGEIRQEGRRILHCVLCGTEWEYPRLKCPYCENENQEKLTYFQVEGEAGYRVDICLYCQNYLKTVDSREQEGSLNWEVEDYLTLHLDHLAQEEGYTRPARLFAEIRQKSPE